jgi:hypothetical protein
MVVRLMLLTSCCISTDIWSAWLLVMWWCSSGELSYLDRIERLAYHDKRNAEATRAALAQQMHSSECTFMPEINAHSKRMTKVGKGGHLDQDKCPGGPRGVDRHTGPEVLVMPYVPYVMPYVMPSICALRHAFCALCYALLCHALCALFDPRAQHCKSCMRTPRARPGGLQWY